MGRNKGCREHGIEPAWSCLICNSPKGSARRIIYGGSITVTDAMLRAAENYIKDVRSLPGPISNEAEYEGLFRAMWEARDADNDR